MTGAVAAVLLGECLAGGASGVVGVVALAVGEGVTRLFQLDLDLAVVALPILVGGDVGEGVVVGADVDGLLHGFGEAVGVEEGFAAGIIGHLQHSAVLGGGLGEELLGVLGHSGGIFGVLGAGVGGGEHGQTHEAAGVDGVNRDLGASEQVNGLAVLVLHGHGGGEGVCEVAVGEDVDGEGAGEPDQIFAAGDRGEIAAEGVHGVERVLGAELELEGRLLGFELLHGGDDGGGSGGVAEGVRHLVGEGVDAVCVAGDGVVEQGRALGEVLLAVDGFAEGVGVGREALQQVQLCGEAEDGHAGSGTRLAEVFEHLLADEGLILHGGVEGVEQEDVDGAGGRCGGVVGEDAGFELGHGRELGGVDDGQCGVLLKMADGLRLAALGEHEVRLRELVDGIALASETTTSTTTRRVFALRV